MAIELGKLIFVKVKSVTRNILKTDTSKPVYFTVQNPIVQAPITGHEKKDANGVPMAPPKIMDVIDLTTGEEATVVCNSVLASSLENKYENSGYVGKSFEVKKFSPEGAKRYATFQISEIALQNPEETKTAKK